MPGSTLNDRYLAIATDIAARATIDADFAYLLRTDPGTALTGYGIGPDDLRGTAESLQPFVPDPTRPDEPFGPSPRCASNSLVPLPIEPE